MTFDERLAQIRAAMTQNGLDLLVGLHDGAHFIEKPNPVMVLAGFKSLGPAAAVIERDGGGHLIVAPRWDRDRAAEQCPDLRVHGTDNVAAGLAQVLDASASGMARSRTVGLAGLSALPSALAQPLFALLRGARNADDLLFDCAAAKTEEEIQNAREATRIAELGYEHLLQIVKPGMSEDELAVEVRITARCSRRPAGGWPRATSLSPRSRRVFADSWRRSAAPSCSESRATRSPRNTRW